MHAASALPALLLLALAFIARADRLSRSSFLQNVTVTGLVKGEYFDRIFTIVLENTDYNTVLTDPNFAKLISNGVLLSDMHSTYHPSQPNYISMLHGDRCMIFLDFTQDCSEGSNLVDLLEAKGVSWATYQEDFPGECFAGDKYPYRRKHNPFISMTNIRQDAARCAKILPAAAFRGSINEPQFIFYTPNMLNDGHDTNFTFSASWLSGFLTPLLNDEPFAHRTLFVVTFDEADTYFSSNQIATVLLGGAGVISKARGTNDTTSYTHMSLLKLVEENWNLGSLGTEDEKSATPIRKDLFN